MTWLKLAMANIANNPAGATVNALLMALGTASVVLLILAGAQVSGTLSRDASGIDLVVGAQGSPVQLILSSVYHADTPPGNIDLEDAEHWMQDRRVAIAAPLALGDSFRGFRIVGTTAAYLDLTGAGLGEGNMWTRPLEAVIGSAVARTTGLKIGDFFSGAHGFSDDGHQHSNHAYKVSGILRPMGSVVDRLVLTSLESVWVLHETAHEDTADNIDDDTDEHRGEHSDDREITALLLRYRNPLAAMTLSREINAAGALLAAAPAVEISRLLQLIGVGLDGLRAFAWVLVATACLSVFAALYGSLNSRRQELAVLRCLGATRAEVFLAILSEGTLLSLLGITLGYVLAHGAIAAVSAWLLASRGVQLIETQWVGAETSLALFLIFVSALSALLPAVQAYRTDVAATLASSGAAN